MWRGCLPIGLVVLVFFSSRGFARSLSKGNKYEVSKDAKLSLRSQAPGYNSQTHGRYVSSYSANRCQDGNKYTYPGVRHMYLWCNFGEFVLMECPSGTEFCPNIGVCCYHSESEPQPAEVTSSVGRIVDVEAKEEEESASSRSFSPNDPFFKEWSPEIPPDDLFPEKDQLSPTPSGTLSQTTPPALPSLKGSDRENMDERDQEPERSIFSLNEKIIELPLETNSENDDDDEDDENRLSSWEEDSPEGKFDPQMTNFKLVGDGRSASDDSDIVQIPNTGFEGTLGPDLAKSRSPEPKGRALSGPVYKEERANDDGDSDSDLEQNKVQTSDPKELDGLGFGFGNPPSNGRVSGLFQHLPTPIDPEEGSENVNELRADIVDSPEQQQTTEQEPDGQDLDVPSSSGDDDVAELPFHRPADGLRPAIAPTRRKPPKAVVSEDGNIRIFLRRDILNSQSPGKQGQKRTKRRSLNISIVFE